jgi:hypothetical protein
MRLSLASWRAWGSRELALHDLLLDVREQHLESAVRNIAGKNQQVGFLTPKFWRDEVASLREESGHIRILTPAGKALDINVFVRRADLDRRYAEPVVRLVPRATTPTSAPASSSTDNSATYSRAKPGPKTTKKWRMVVARALDRIVKEQQRRPSAGELAEICHDECGYLPDESDVAKLVRTLLD